MSLTPEQYQSLDNHELFGKAAAYHAAVQFTEHVENFGLPQTQVKAQTLIIDLARAFICSNITGKGLTLEKGKAMDFALKSLYKTIYNPNPVAWRVTHTIPFDALKGWTAGDEDYYKSYQHWAGDEYNYGDFGPREKKCAFACKKAPSPPPCGSQISSTKPSDCVLPPLPLPRCKSPDDVPERKHHQENDLRIWRRR
ncbi:hypothetical protein SCHPADRAFT_891187 [Schizopora paradoxa]|uniref:Uncharacterized protein n=1 Tax=Schizopora paradoxa TaxID=27342 RepID=A0A0H2S4T3_9AGAM|nr:hypothetical protein SCHPADRAFT_891187 [Schizopora paradoxa]